MRISILGGAGFIGTNLADLLLQGKHEVSVIDNLSMGNQIEKSGLNLRVEFGDISDPDILLEYLERNKPERVYHLAANSDIKNSSRGSNSDVRNTFLTTSSLVSCSHNFKIDELVFASSSAVYGESELSVAEDADKRPISPYGWMKLASEELLLQSAQSGLIEKLLIARFPNVTGHWQTHGVIFDFISQLKINQKMLNVLGDGYQDKPYILASELASILEQLITLDFGKIGIFNISPSSSTNVKRIVELICEIGEINPQVNYGITKGGWAGDVPSYKLDASLLQKTIPSLNLRQSDEAIIEAIRWLWEKSDA
jgi:UDP-glucose 4-epimerase